MPLALEAGGVFQGQRGWGGQILPNQGFSFCSCCLHAVLFSSVRLFSIKMCAMAWNRLCPSAQRRGSSTTQSAWSLPMAKTGGEGKVPVVSLSRAGKRKVRRGQCRDSGGRRWLLLLRVKLTGKQGRRIELMKGLSGERSGWPWGTGRSQNPVSKAERRCPYPMEAWWLGPLSVLP